MQQVCKQPLVVFTAISSNEWTPLIFLSSCYLSVSQKHHPNPTLP